MRIKSSIIAHTTKNVDNILDWAKSHKFKIRNIHTPTGNNLMFEGYEDSQDYKDILSYFNENGLEIEIKGKNIIYSKDELNKFELLICVPNVEIYVTNLELRTGCKECGIYDDIYKVELPKEKIPKMDLIHLVGIKKVITSNKLKENLEANQIRGLNFSSLQGLDDYSLLNIIGRIGDPTEKTPFKNCIICPKCNRKVVSFSIDTLGLDIHNIHFPRASYDGSDIALSTTTFVGVPYFFVISNKLYKLLIEEKATGFYVIPTYLD